MCAPPYVEPWLGQHHIAGNPGQPGYVDGPGGAAQSFNGMTEIACLADGTLDVSDAGNSSVVRNLECKGAGCPQLPSVPDAPSSGPQLKGVSSHQGAMYKNVLHKLSYRSTTQTAPYAHVMGGGARKPFTGGPT